MSSPLRVLLLEDSPTDAAVIVAHLEAAGYLPDWRRVETEAAYRTALDPTLDLLIVDYTLPAFSGRQALRLLADSGWDVPAIVVTGTMTDADAVDLLQLGAADYLLKDRLARLGDAVRTVLHQRTLRGAQAAAEGARRTSEARAEILAQILDQCDQPVMVTTPDGQVLLGNAALCGLLACSEEALRERNWFRALTPPEWAPLQAEKLAGLDRIGQSVRYAMEIVRTDGARVPVEVLARLLRPSAEVPAYYAVFFTDLRECQRAARDLAMRTRQLEAVRTIGEAINRELDLPRVLRLITTSIAELVGYGTVTTYLWDDQDQCLVPRAWSTDDAVPPDGRAPVRLGEELVGQVAAERVGRIVSDPSTAGIGTRRLGFAEPLLYQDRLVGILSVENDAPFTEEHRAILRLLAPQAAIAIEHARVFQLQQTMYRDLQRAQAELVRTEKLRAVGQMAAGVAHDLNNKLAVIIGQTDLLRFQGTDARLEGALAAIHAAGQGGAEVVRRLQDFARQRPQAPLVPLDLASVVAEALEITRPHWGGTAQRHGAVVQIQNRVPAGVAILGNAGEVQEALVNLILNAVDAMPAGGSLELHTTGVAADSDPSAGSAVDLAVTDTGIGMSEEVRHQVFEPFFTTKGPQATGLGLAVVYGIMKRHGGRVAVDSAPGHGTTVTLRFPAAPLGAEIRSPTTAGAPRRILVIDDDPAVRDTICGLLQVFGHVVLAAASGAEGLRVLETATPQVDLVITDLVMPGMTGWEVARAIKSSRRPLPVVLLTGWGELDQPTGEAGLVDRTLSKPIGSQDLLQVVADLPSAPPASDAATDRQ